MKKLVTSVALSIAMAFATAAPAVSAPLSVPSAPEVTAMKDLQNVRSRRGHRGGIYRRGGVHYYNGHRGYRHRPSRRYQRYNGFWFPLAAFGLGAAIASQPRYVRPAPRYYYHRRNYLPAAHYRWCYNRYRSYRDYDNTFQPYHGPRRQCYSPYS